MSEWPDASPHLSDAPRGGGASRRRWVVAACALLALGLAASLVSALLWRSSVRTHERQTFQNTATDVSETLETQLRRDTDFVATLRGVLTMQPGLSASGFSQWFAALEGNRQQVGGLGTLVVRSVPAAELAAAQARREAEPAFRALSGGGTVESVVPDGRARYCLLTAGVVSTPYNPGSLTCWRGTGATRTPRPAPTRRRAAPPRRASCSRSRTADSSWCTP